MADEQANTIPETTERVQLLEQLEEWVEIPMVILSFAWLLLVVVELVWGTSHLLEVFGTAIWIIFVAEFMLKFQLAPQKARFVKRNWLIVIALVVPAVRLLRIFRVFRVVRAVRGLRLIRIVGTANRGMAAVRASMRRRGLGYVLTISAVIILVGAGGMLAFEPAAQVDGGFASYGDALWWTAMLLTSIGSEFWPKTVEGRLLCFLLSLYGFAVFGYITASFASYFVDRDAAANEGQVAGASDVRSLSREIAALRTELRK